MDKDVIDGAENIEIVLRFPIFQVQKSVHQWSYSFNLKDFKQAVRHADENCTPETFAEMMKKEG